jgi:hypothetical protein
MSKANERSHHISSQDDCGDSFRSQIGAGNGNNWGFSGIYAKPAGTLINIISNAGVHSSHKYNQKNLGKEY